MNQQSTGLEYWRSLEQLAESDEVREMMRAEFPGYDPDEIRSMSRRRFMKLMAASMALAGVTLTGCRRWPKEKLAAYSSNPKDRIPGIAEEYATTMEVGGVGQGLLVKSFDGRPIKVEGNPSHPYARTINPKIGAADAFAQASVLELYDPERSRAVVHRSGDGSGGNRRVSSWEEFARVIGQQLAAPGRGVAVLSEASYGPSFTDMRRRFRAKFPEARWFEYEPLGRDNAPSAADQAARPRYFLDKAMAVVCLDADLLGGDLAHVRHAADWAVLRKSADEQGAARRMSRWHVIESCFSGTGAAADERLAVRPSKIRRLAGLLASLVGVDTQGAGTEALTEAEVAFVRNAAEDLKRHGKNALVAAGAHLEPEVRQLADAINGHLQSIGNTVVMLAEPREPGIGTIRDLAIELKAGRVQTLIILGGNPAYDSPADLDFASLIKTEGKPLTVHLSLYENETSARCAWHLPRAHALECWGDSRAWDGTVATAQPLILPLYAGRSVIEVLALLNGDPVTEGERIVRRTFAEQKLAQGEDFEKTWRRILHDGVVENSAWPPMTGRPQQPQASQSAPVPEGFEVRFLADAKVYDGRFANNGWLQECPDPMTMLTWDNAAQLSPADAAKLGVAMGDVIRVTVGGRSLEIAAYILPGQPAGVVGLPLGYGRSTGHIASGVGFNTYTLRTSEAMWSAAGAAVEKTGRTYKLALTQHHHLIDRVGEYGVAERVGGKFESGKIIREAKFVEYAKDRHAVAKDAHGPKKGFELQMYSPPKDQITEPAWKDGDQHAPIVFNRPHAWGMSVDMNACLGCNACMVACTAENNVPIVGKSQVLMSREMWWIRIDRYFKGGVENPQVVFQPMLCVHCENAPCEQVCPVAATVHDTEGLNTMVYNRCIGTRYCANNCPYKVRRFNYFDYHSRNPRGGNDQMPWLGMPDAQQNEKIDPIKRMVYNPDVTVRMRGVMEKCTYCVQRIKEKTIEAKNQGKAALEDGNAVVTACQQACPTQAIVFGDLNTKDAEVAKLHRNPRSYSVLDEDLNTRPRTKHMAKLRNPVGA